MKTKLVLFFLLLFVTFSVQSIAHDAKFSIHLGEVEILVESENSEQESEKEALASVSFFYDSMYISSVLPSSIFLNNFLYKNNAYKPPIS